VALRQLLVALG